MRYPKPVALVATLALAVFAAPAVAAPLRITFAGKSGPGNRDLFTVTPAGEGRKKITSGPADDAFPTVAPTRTLVAFARTTPSDVRRLFTVPPAGGAVHAIPNTLHGGAPSWAPDGARIAFDSSHGAGPSRIYTISPNGAGRTELTAGPSDSYPSWSPDSKFVAFQRKGQLWRIRADGTQLKKLTNNGKQPAWRPNGKHIAFIRKVDGKGVAIFTMEPNGSNVKQLTLKGPGKEKDSRPAWEPNSRHVVYAALAAGQSSIRTMLFGGSVPATPENVTPGETPAW
jgi:Tol biopolymer transport system component